MRVSSRYYTVGARRMLTKKTLGPNPLHRRAAVRQYGVEEDARAARGPSGRRELDKETRVSIRGRRAHVSAPY